MHRTKHRKLDHPKGELCRTECGRSRLLFYFASFCPSAARVRDAVIPARRATVQGDDAPVARVAGEVEKLPAGPGKDIVGAACAQCHALQQLDRGHDAGQWQLTVERMLAAGAKVPPAQVDTVVAYLAKNFPEKPLPPAVIVPGNANVVVQGMDVADQGLAAARSVRGGGRLHLVDGATDATSLGRLDPKTGVMKEYPLKMAGSGPHGLVADKDGNIWYTANSKGYIGKLNPKTGDTDRYQLPDPARSRSPHPHVRSEGHPLVHRCRTANIVGRLIRNRRGEGGQPAHAEEQPVRDRDEFQGHAVRSANSTRTSSPASIRPRWRFKEYALPNPDDAPPADRHHERRCDLVCGLFARLSRPVRSRDRKSQGVRVAWRSEIAALRDYGGQRHRLVQRSEHQPNTLVRFDPKTEKFQTWAIPSGGGVVRNMMATKDGNLVLAESGVNKVALVEILK